MPNLMWTWQEAAVIAGALAVGWGVLHWRQALRRTQPFLRESSLIIGLYALWQFAGSLSGNGTYAAVGRGQWIWNTERSAHLLSEHTVQGWILPHPLIVQAANLYYDTMHFTMMIVFLFWLFIRHRDAYPRWRTTLAILTASCLLIQLIPVAPPRMLLNLDMVDTAMKYGQSVYGTVTGFRADQLSAMPSVHVGWALLIAACVYSVGTSRWRYIGIVHAVMTILVVVATGNHYWGDGIVSAALLIAAFFAQRGIRKLRQKRVTARKDLTKQDVGRGGLVDVR
ncbi:MAG TPA: phosphatase PAP2 family protein [Actinocrinis sp.]|nr:phosphatase PAP2 family protein [Actinocrinis sp.]